MAPWNGLRRRWIMQLLPEADIVVLAAPETADTRRMIGPAQFAAMRRDAVLVNVSRASWWTKPRWRLH